MIAKQRSIVLICLCIFGYGFLHKARQKIFTVNHYTERSKEDITNTHVNHSIEIELSMIFNSYLLAQQTIYELNLDDAIIFSPDNQNFYIRFGRYTDMNVALEAIHAFNLRHQSISCSIIFL